MDPRDQEHTSVAVVTSGTGEHIATTLAASTCASRVYYSQKMGQTGGLESVTEEEAISAMINAEFTGELFFFLHYLFGS
jgi:taspase (threonine aspartase 1)